MQRQVTHVKVFNETKAKNSGGYTATKKKINVSVTVLGEKKTFDQELVVFFSNRGILKNTL